jgi:hypothetical protein
MGRWNIVEKCLQGFVGTLAVKNFFVDLGVEWGGG